MLTRVILCGRWPRRPSAGHHLAVDRNFLSVGRNETCKESILLRSLDCSRRRHLWVFISTETLIHSIGTHENLKSPPLDNSNALYTHIFAPIGFRAAMVCCQQPGAESQGTGWRSLRDRHGSLSGSVACQQRREAGNDT